MTSATQTPNVTQQLDAVFDQVGVEVLALNFAQVLAKAVGLNRTSAGICFYRWRAARLVQEQRTAGPARFTQHTAALQGHFALVGRTWLRGHAAAGPESGPPPKARH